MLMDTDFSMDKDFEYLLTFLPEGWQEMAKKLGALSRCRKIPNAETLLRILLIHLAEGCSLRETAARVAASGLLKISDVTIMNRLRVSGNWFKWIGKNLMQNWIHAQPEIVFGNKWRIRLVDGTRIVEPGPTGSSWNVHYSITLPSLHCCELKVSKGRGSGETFKRFTISQNDLMIGDRIYGTPPSIAHVLEGGGSVIARFGWTLLPLWEKPGQRFDLFAHLRKLSGTRIGDWPVQIKHDGKFYRGRVCALKKSRQATKKAMAVAKYKAMKNGSKTRPETLEAAGYVMVFTTLNENEMSKKKVLEMYRGRWQIELVFKRLKTLLGFGHLRKHDYEASQSWIHGKLMVAFLLEALIKKGETFFPWGYPICEQDEQMPLA